MKISNLFAYSVPELRRLTGEQLMKIWSSCVPFSRNRIYFHMIVMLACCSLIFNLALFFSDSVLLILFALLLGLTVPSNLYFFVTFKDRRQDLRQFIEENWEEYRPE